MKKLLILTEVYKPEDFIINDIVEEFSKSYEILVVTRAPTYPKGEIFDGFKNTFSVNVENGIKVIRYPVFLKYNKSVITKVANLIWQPIAVLLILSFLRWERLFVYQTGSLYSYSLLCHLRLRKNKSIIWSQDLWPEVGYESGFPKIWPLKNILSLISKFTLTHFSQVLVQSDSFQEYYKTKYSIESQVIYNFSRVRKSNVYLDRSQKQSFIYAGNIGVLQNLEEVISLYLLLKDSSLPINSMEIYGEGSRYLEMKKKYSEFNDIKFFGRVSSTTVQVALNNSRYAVFSLRDGPIQKTIPSRLQFLFNNNIPIVYLGKGATSKFIHSHNCGIAIESLKVDKNEIIQQFVDFENSKFFTRDVFNKKEIIKELVKVIS